MRLDHGKACAVFQKVKQVQEEVIAYCLAPDRPDLSVEDFQLVVERMYQLKIEKFQVAFEGSFLRGMMERYPDRSVIYVQKNQTEDWKRFIAVKELCHIVNDEKEDWSPLGESTIKNLLAEYQIAGKEVAPNVIQSETFAEIAAIELLYPFKERVSDLKLLKTDENFSIAKIAAFYKIPETIAAQALSDWYMELSTDIWASI